MHVYVHICVAHAAVRRCIGVIGSCESLEEDSGG